MVREAHMIVMELFNIFDVNYGIKFSPDKSFELSQFHGPGLATLDELSIRRYDAQQAGQASFVSHL